MRLPDTETPFEPDNTQDRTTDAKPLTTPPDLIVPRLRRTSHPCTRAVIIAAALSYCIISHETHALPPGALVSLSPQWIFASPSQSERSIDPISHS